MTTKITPKQTESKVIETETAYVLGDFTVQKSKVYIELSQIPPYLVDILNHMRGIPVEHAIVEKLKAKRDAELEKQRQKEEEYKNRLLEERRREAETVRDYFDAGKIQIFNAGKPLDNCPEDFSTAEIGTILNACNHCGVIYGESAGGQIIDAKIVKLLAKPDMEIICIGNV